MFSQRPKCLLASALATAFALKQFSLRSISISLWPRWCEHPHNARCSDQRTPLIRSARVPFPSAASSPASREERRVRRGTQSSARADPSTPALELKQAGGGIEAAGFNQVGLGKCLSAVVGVINPLFLGGHGCKVSEFGILFRATDHGMLKPLNPTHRFCYRALFS